MIIDIHSHLPASLGELVRIKNLDCHEHSASIEGHGPLSIGHHPWNTEKFIFNPELLYQQADNTNVAAIGEAGIDKLRGGPLSKQLVVFEVHTEISENLKKSLVIHCVKGSSEISNIYKSIKPNQSWIIHGFRGNDQLANQLLSAGMYLSYGKHLMNSSGKIMDAFKITPIDRLFMESDESQEPIIELYQFAASMKNLSLEDFSEAMRNNFNRVFNWVVTADLIRFLRMTVGQ